MKSVRAITIPRSALVVLVLLAWLADARCAHAQGAPAASGGADGGVRIDLRARSFRPGELVVVDLAVPAAAADVRVSVFGRTIAAFPLGGGAWRALAGIDLDQRPGSYRIEAQAIGGAVVQRAARALAVERRVFPLRTLRVAPDYVNPPPSVVERIAQEQQFTREVYAQSAGQRQWRGPFVRPVPHPANSRFGTRSVFNGEPRSPHAGADFLSPAGTPVHAPNSGRIVCARELFFTGNTVIVDHGLGVFSLMAHLSRLDVTEGEDVVAGQPLGAVGATGRVTGPHLHWAMAVAGARVDPLSVLALLGAPK